MSVSGVVEKPNLKEKNFAVFRIHEILVWILWLVDPDPDPDPGGQKHVDPVDPDSDPNPEHWNFVSGSSHINYYEWNESQI